jgi:diacylglycerol kinase (ATP)
MNEDSIPSKEGRLRRVMVLVNPHSGLPRSLVTMQRAIESHWDLPGTDLFYQFTRSAQDGVDKVKRALERDLDVVLVAGGDGTVSTVGRALVGTSTALGVIPTGSGNGFARHFGIPLTPARAVEGLSDADVRDTDVGVVNGTYFFVTCSMAWDASIVRSFDRSPVRGVLPYIFAGVQELFQFEAQDIEVSIDSCSPETFSEPMVFTIANMTQFGGGALIAPQARADDGLLELVVALRQDVPMLIANIGRLFDGSVNKLPQVSTRQLRTMRVTRASASPIQIDGELVDADREVEVGIRPGALRVLVPPAKK